MSGPGFATTDAPPTVLYITDTPPVVNNMIRKIAVMRTNARPVTITGWTAIADADNTGVCKVGVVKFGAVKEPGVVNSLVLGVPNTTSGLRAIVCTLYLQTAVGVTVVGPVITPIPPGLAGRSGGNLLAVWKDSLPTSETFALTSVTKVLVIYVGKSVVFTPYGPGGREGTRAGTGGGTTNGRFTEPVGNSYAGS